VRGEGLGPLGGCGGYGVREHGEDWGGGLAYPGGGRVPVERGDEVVEDPAFGESGQDGLVRRGVWLALADSAVCGLPDSGSPTEDTSRWRPSETTGVPAEGTGKPIGLLIVL
jgi:hypothetical protein